MVLLVIKRSHGLFVQFVDDVMDFTSSSKVMGKPALNDLKGGIATAPVLFAAEEYPELSPLILRRFNSEGDVDTAVRLVMQSRGIERTQELAAKHAAQAAQAVSRSSQRKMHSLQMRPWKRAGMTSSSRILFGAGCRVSTCAER